MRFPSTRICWPASTICEFGHGWLPVTSPKNRCGHHGRRRRQNVLGPAGRAARGRAGHSLGLAQHGLARRRRPAQPHAHADHRRVHRRAPSHGRFLIEHERFPAGKVSVIPNGVDTIRFAPIAELASIRRELGIDQPIQWWVSSRHCVPKKTTSCFWKWLAELVINCRTRDFLSSATVPAAQSLEQLAQRLRVVAERRFSRLA